MSFLGPSKEELFQRLKVEARGVFEVMKLSPTKKRMSNGKWGWECADPSGWNAIPLEFRDTVRLNLEDAVAYLCEFETLKEWKKHGGGGSETLQAFAAPVAYVQAILSRAYTSEGRTYHRVLTWYQLRLQLAERAHFMGFMGGIGDIGQDDYGLLPKAKEALEWFPDEVALQTALKAFTGPIPTSDYVPGLELGPLSVADFRRLAAKVEEGVAKKLAGASAEKVGREAAKTRQTPPTPAVPATNEAAISPVESALRELLALHVAGLITTSDYEAKKKDILARL